MERSGALSAAARSASRSIRRRRSNRAAPSTHGLRSGRTGSTVHASFLCAVFIVWFEANKRNDNVLYHSFYYGLFRLEQQSRLSTARTRRCRLCAHAHNRSQTGNESICLCDCFFAISYKLGTRKFPSICGFWLLKNAAVQRARMSRSVKTSRLWTGTDFYGEAL